MPLWGASLSDESQPKYLTTEDKRFCYATSRGWVLKGSPQQGSKTTEEILVAIPGLMTTLGNSNVSGMYIASNAPVRNTSFQIILWYNTRVNANANATIVLAADNDGANNNVTLNCSAVVQNNQLVFTGITPLANVNLNVSAQSIAGDTSIVGADDGGKNASLIITTTLAEQVGIIRVRG